MFIIYVIKPIIIKFMYYIPSHLFQLFPVLNLDLYPSTLQFGHAGPEWTMVLGTIINRDRWVVGLKMTIF